MLQDEALARPTRGSKTTERQGGSMGGLPGGYRGAGGPSASSREIPSMSAMFSWLLQQIKLSIHPPNKLLDNL